MQFIRVSRCIGVAALACLPLYSQSISSGTITGLVTDSSGAVIASASAQLKNPITGYQQTAATDSSGAFRFNNVPRGNYQSFPVRR